LLKFLSLSPQLISITVLLPVKTAGVKGDERAYEEVIAERMVKSQGWMSALVTEMAWFF
jgi:GMP synthase (glutamine-hydrolysing)